MSRAITAIFAITLLMGFVYFVAHRHPRRHARHAYTDDATATAEADAQPQQMDIASQAPKANAPTTVQMKLPPGAKRQSSVTDDKKVHLDIAKLLLKDAAFRLANPGLTLEKFMSGEADMDKIKLPKGLKISYEFDPACRDAQNTVATLHKLSPREDRNLSHGAPAYLTREVNDESTTVASLSAQTSTDNCIRGLTFDAGSKVGDKTVGDLTASVQAQAEQKQIADQAVQDALRADGQAKMAVIGLKSDLKSTDPSLMIRATDGHYLATPANYQIGGGTDAPGDSVLLQRRAFVVHPDTSGTYSDSDVSNAIIHAADRGYKVIDVPLASFDPKNYQSAIDYAKERGAVVVKVPIPPPSKTVPLPIAPSTTRLPSQTK
jgi:hypothetical protein